MLSLDDLKWNMLGLLLIIVFGLCLVEVVYVDYLITSRTAKTAKTEKCSFTPKKLIIFS